MKFFKKQQKNQINPFGIERGEFEKYNFERNPEQNTISRAVIDEGWKTKNKQFLGKTISPQVYRNIIIIIIITIGVFVARAADLQIIHGDKYRALAEGNRIRIETIPARRGIVYDRNGQILIENYSAFSVTVTSADLPKDESEREAVLSSVSSAIGISIEEIESVLKEYQDVPFEPIPIARNVPHEPAMLLATQVSTLPGVKIVMSIERSYATAQALSLSHVLGFLGQINPDEIDKFLELGYRRTDEIGRQGIEMTYETLLRGKPGRKIIEVDALGQEISVINREDPVDGQNITLSIDADLQAYIELLINEAAQISGNNKAAVIAMDPNNGEILALVSLPSFDSNDFSGGIKTSIYASLLENEDQPLFPRAIAGEYPSGSTFKPVVAAAALAEGIINEYTSFLSSGGISIKQWFFPDWKAGGHGLTDVRMAIAESVNTFFYIIGGGLDDFEGLGVARITEYAKKFGLGSQTGIDLPGEASGFLPSKEWKEKQKGERWYVGDTYHLAIGQGDILVTPIQLAVMTSIFANGGTLYEPRLLHSEEPVVLNEQVVDPKLIQIVREGLRGGVTYGSSRYLQTVTEPVAGKTGTAQAGGDAENHAWWTGFGPYDSPEIVLTILIENGGEGSVVAVPLARDIFNWWFENR